MYSVKNTDGRKPAKILHTLLIMHTILNIEKARLSDQMSLLFISIYSIRFYFSTLPKYFIYWYITVLMYELCIYKVAGDERRYKKLCNFFTGGGEGWANYLCTCKRKLKWSQKDRWNVVVTDWHIEKAFGIVQWIRDEDAIHHKFWLYFLGDFLRRQVALPSDIAVVYFGPSIFSWINSETKILIFRPSSGREAAMAALQASGELIFATLSRSFCQF
jgi:hypothetical protein